MLSERHAWTPIVVKFLEKNWKISKMKMAIQTSRYRHRGLTSMDKSRSKIDGMLYTTIGKDKERKIG